MNLYNFAYFQIAAKAIIKKNDRILLLITQDGYYDFPGGRMDESEVELSLHNVLARELAEELGDKLSFDIGSIAFASKRQYGKNQEHRILAIFYEVLYKSGGIKLSDEHSDSKWIKPNDILGNPEKFISKDEYKQYRQYCHQNSGQ